MQGSEYALASSAHHRQIKGFTSSDDVKPRIDTSGRVCITTKETPLLCAALFLYLSSTREVHHNECRLSHIVGLAATDDICQLLNKADTTRQLTSSPSGLSYCSLTPVPDAFVKVWPSQT